MKIGSLFSGIGGLERGLELAGLGSVAWQVECDPFARGVLARHWPDVDRHVEDVRHANSLSLSKVDLVCGGFPCQDVSAAGKGAGLAGARSGLWYEFLRILGDLAPAFAIVENVASGAKRWLPHVRRDLHVRRGSRAPRLDRRMTPEQARAQLIKVQREIGVRGSFYDFVRMAWPLVEPGRPFKDNWHIRLICDHLEKVFRGEIRRLVINIPPGCMKSLLVSVFWPAWCWIRDPSFRWIFASFDGSLTARDARKTMNVVTSSWFKDRWGFLVDEDAAVSDHATTGAGFRFSTSIKGKLTGRHCDCAVIDDPIKPLDLSSAELETVRDWWTGSLPSRFGDLPTARIVIIMQRLHCDDLTGIVEQEPGWTFLRLPMRYEPDAANDNDPRTEEGELLWPERFPKDEVDRLEIVMGRRNFATQYQQSPTPDGGIIFDRAWFKHYEVAPATFDKVIQSWDLTFKDTKSADYVCGQVWGRKGGEFYLLDQVLARMSFSATCEEIRKMRRKWPRATTILIEDKANGSAVIDVLKKSIPGILPVNPQGGKEARANAVSPFFEAGNVYHPNPEKVSWVDKHRDELALFPASKHDDSVDACTQALTYLYARANRYREAMAKVQKMIARGRGVLRVIFSPVQGEVAT